MTTNAILNVTHNGLSQDLPQPVPADVSDQDIRRIALECLELPQGTFLNFVVDRFDTPGVGVRIYLRPKVPFGGPGAGGASL
jgi:hypothetical protein